MIEPRILVGVASFVFAAAILVWGISVFLQSRAHRKRMDARDEEA